MREFVGRLAAEGFEFYDEVGGKVDEVFFILTLGDGSGCRAEVGSVCGWVQIFGKARGEHVIWVFASQVVHVKDVAECFIKFAKCFF